MSLRDTATAIVRTLRDAGHVAYFAGGCVRDMLMDCEPEDVDVATSATPGEIRDLFERTHPIGESFGVMLVLRDGHEFEVATFRSDGPYTDGRHPDSVAFTDVEGDVRRRDFTVNGMMYDPVDDEVIDLVGGRADLEAKLIRAIGDPRARFEEDRLRMVRAARFSARLAFSIEPETARAIVELAPTIATVSAERVAEELRRMLAHPRRAEAVRRLDDLHLLAHILPEVAAMKGVAQSEVWHPEGDVFEHTLRCLEETPADAGWELSLAVLLHDVGKPAVLERGEPAFVLHEKVGAEIAEAACRRLRLSNREREHVVWLVKNHMRFLVAPQMKPAKLRRLMQEPLFEELAQLHRIDALGSGGDLSAYEFVMEQYRQFREEPPPEQPLVNGHDLIERGLSPGPVFSEVLDELYDAQLEGKFADRDAALAALDELLKRRGLTG